MRGDRFARHWHDVARLDEAGLADAAIADQELAGTVARHKSMFFSEKAADRTPIDYGAAVNGSLRLVPATVRRRWKKTMLAWSRIGCSWTTRKRSRGLRRVLRQDELGTEVASLILPSQYDRGPGYTTRCFCVTFEDGTTGHFSMDKALRAIAVWAHRLATVAPLFARVLSWTPGPSA